MYSYLLRFSKPYMFRRTISPTPQSSPPKNLNPLGKGLLITFVGGAIGIKLMTNKDDEQISWRYGCHGHPNNLKSYKSATIDKFEKKI